MLDFLFFKPNAEKIQKWKETKDYEKLLKCVNHRDLFIKMEALKAVGQIADDTAKEILKQAMKDEDPQVRMTVAEIIGQTGDMSMESILVLATSDLSDDVQKVAKKALRQLGLKAKQASPKPYQPPRSDAEGQAASRGTPSAPIALETETAEMTPVEPIVEPSANDLGIINEFMQKFEYDKAANMGKMAVKPLLKELEKEVLMDNNKRSIVRALSKIKSSSAIEGLSNYYPAASMQIQAEVVKTLGDIGHPAAVKCLSDALKHQKAPIRYNAVTSLEKLGKHPAVINALAAASQDSEEYVRAAAKKAWTVLSK